MCQESCYGVHVTRQGSAVHVARVVRKYHTKDGESRESVSHLLRRSYREEGKIRHETLGNISALPAPALEALRASLAGKTLVVAVRGSNSSARCPMVTWPQWRPWQRLWGFPSYSVPRAKNATSPTP